MSDANQDAQEKTHEATPHKLEQAREKGDIAVSREITALAAYLGLAAGIGLFSVTLIPALAARLTPFLHSASELVLLGDGYVSAAGGPIKLLLLASCAAIGLPALLVIAALVAQRAIVFAPSKLAPKLSRLSVISNAKQKYGPTGLMEFLKSATKLSLISVALWFVTIARFDAFVGLVQAAPVTLPSLLLREGMITLMAVIGISALVAGVDLGWQLFDYRRRNRMSHQELRDEMKHTDGDPMMKGRRRERAQSIATNRMLIDVPTADVVIVNPTHYAVALKWARTPGSAPLCVAKGTDEVATRIREVAESNGVPIHSDPPLARSVHALVPRPLPPPFYSPSVSARGEKPVPGDET
jgi:flagellar biosynthetic protein FlhB